MRKKNTTNYHQNDCQQVFFITPLFSVLADTLKTKVDDVVGCIFEVECSVNFIANSKSLVLDHLVPSDYK
jgi:hypothetical protein